MQISKYLHQAFIVLIAIQIAMIFVPGDSLDGGSPGFYGFVVNFFYAIVTLLSIPLFLIGIIKYLFAYGDINKKKIAKYFALYGLIIFLLSFLRIFLDFISTPFYLPG